MSRICIYFQEQTEFELDKKGRQIKNLGWTSRMKTDYININELFKKRLDKLSRFETAEKASILFMIAVVIIHELGHLLLRWAGHYMSPEDFKHGDKAEAGYFLEKELFGSTVHVKIASSHEWNEDTSILGIIQIII